MQYVFIILFIAAVVFAVWEFWFRCKHDWKRVNKGTVHRGGYCVGSFYDYECQKCARVKREDI